MTNPKRPDGSDSAEEAQSVAISRRDFFKGAGVTGLAAATSPVAFSSQSSAAASPDGTPEQIHLTWGSDPTRTVFASWASPAQAVNPRVILQRPDGKPSVIHALQRTYTDGLNGQTVFTYHAQLEGL
jgi:hypothetical protein